ncbi:MAG: hypothetical protein Ct9H300mP12_17540 [Acidimicrobiales bacterium]|nr:MAG: hypothetical protein Ct9H300mP12_17540 [Acidimicrobiales bacterium]
MFRLREHIERLFRSAKILFLDIPYDVNDLVAATLDTVRANGHQSCYIRPLVYLGYGEMGLNPLSCSVDVSIATFGPWGTYLGDEGLANGVDTMISSWQRHDPNAMPPAAKGCGHYINSQMAKVQAVKAGYDEAILLSPQGYVSECTGENLFMVRDGASSRPHLARGHLRVLPRVQFAVSLKTWGSRISRATSCAATCTRPTRRSCQVLPLRWCRSGRSMIGSSAPGTGHQPHSGHLLPVRSWGAPRIRRVERVCRRLSLARCRRRWRYTTPRCVMERT